MVGVDLHDSDEEEVPAMDKEAVQTKFVYATRLIRHLA